MAFQKNLRTRTITTVLDFMSATLYTDAIEIIQNAETVRRQIGIVNTRQEERLARTAVLLLAFAFEAFINEQLQYTPELTIEKLKEKTFTEQASLSEA